MLPLIQVIVAAVLVVYAGVWLWQQSRRRAQTWNQIIGQLHANDWGIEEVSERYLYKSGVHATTADVWERIHGCQGLWAMYRNCPVLIQLADYAAQHGDGVDQEMLAGLRRDAMQIRLCVIMALGQYILHASSGDAAVNAHKAVTTYSAMMMRLTTFVQEYSTSLFPSYLSAVA